jgi:hypothetical protein
VARVRFAIVKDADAFSGHSLIMNEAHRFLPVQSHMQVHSPTAWKILRSLFSWFVATKINLVLAIRWEKSRCTLTFETQLLFTRGFVN